MCENMHSFINEQPSHPTIILLAFAFNRASHESNDPKSSYQSSARGIYESLDNIHFLLLQISVCTSLCLLLSLSHHTILSSLARLACLLHSLHLFNSTQLFLVLWWWYVTRNKAAITKKNQTTSSVDLLIRWPQKKEDQKKQQYILSQQQV